MNVELVLRGGVDAPEAARRAVIAADGSLPASVRDDVLLVVTELVTNAVRHAGVGPERSVRVALRQSQGRMRLEVLDPGTGEPDADFARAGTRPRKHESNGWGLFLVDQIADRWGVARTPSGTCVWCEIES